MSLNQHVGQHLYPLPDFPVRKPKCRAQCKETHPAYMVLLYALLEITLNGLSVRVNQRGINVVAKAFSH